MKPLSLWTLGAIVLAGMFLIGTTLAFAFQYAEDNARAREIEPERLQPPEPPVLDAGPPKVPCGAVVFR